MTTIFSYRFVGGNVESVEHIGSNILQSNDSV